MANPSVAQLKPDVGYGRPVLPALSRSWWSLALRGVLAVMFGLAAFFLPNVTFASLVPLFGAYALVDGVLAVAGAARMAGPNERRWLLLEGVSGALVGGLALLWSGLTAPVLLYCVAVWALATGFFEIVGAARLRREIEGERALLSGGIASVIFGLILVVLPGVDILSFLWLIGVYALVFGASLIVLALRVQGRQAPPARESGPWLRSRRGRPPGPATPRGRSRGERASERPPRVTRRSVESLAGPAGRSEEDSIGRGDEESAGPVVGRGSEDAGGRGWSEAPATAPVRCQRIKSNGERCKGRAVRDSDWCAVHHPDYQEKRRQNAAKKKAKKANDRGRLPSSSDLNEVQDLIRSTLLGVYQGKIERSVGMAMFQGCEVLLQTIETQKKLIELEESMERLETEPHVREGRRKGRLG